jgi:hypothetical protein
LIHNIPSLPYIMPYIMRSPCWQEPYPLASPFVYTDDIINAISRHDQLTIQFKGETRVKLEDELDIETLYRYRPEIYNAKHLETDRPSTTGDIGTSTISDAPTKHHTPQESLSISLDRLIRPGLHWEIYLGEMSLVAEVPKQGTEPSTLHPGDAVKPLDSRQQSAMRDHPSGGDTSMSTFTIPVVIKVFRFPVYFHSAFEPIGREDYDQPPSRSEAIRGILTEQGCYTKHLLEEQGKTIPYSHGLFTDKLGTKSLRKTRIAVSILEHAGEQFVSPPPDDIAGFGGETLRVIPETSK